MSAQVFYDNPAEAAVVVPVTFLNAAGVVTDPTSVSCVVTDPTGTATTYTYGVTPPNNIITHTSTGNYALTITGLTVAGLYTGTWIGTGGGVQQVTPTTFRIVPLNAVGTGMTLWYTGREELKSRLNITDNNSDYEIQLAIQAVTNWINTYCLVADTPVLTADLRWVPVGSLAVGDDLVGVEEYGTGKRPKRHYLRSTVTANPRRLARCTKITLSDGRTVTSADDHRWLARSNRGKTGPVYQWVHASDISPGFDIAAPFTPWQEEADFESGWVSGIFDGEGWLHSARPGEDARNGTGAHVGVAQNPGAVLSRVEHWLKERDIPYGFNGDAKCKKLEIWTRAASMEVLGRLQPCRLMPRSHEVWEGGQVTGSALVIAVEDAGVREVVSLGTSTGTFIANGLVSHNCGRHFYQLTETRTYQPSNIWELPIDDVVPSKAATMQVNLDYEGDGTYNTSWGNPAPPIGTGKNYTLKLGTPGGYEDNFNVNAAGVPRPYTQLQALMGAQGSNLTGGGWLPFVWPYTVLNRVQIIATWGWEVIPPSVAQASLLLCTDVFKSKDAPWGVAGTAETGLMRVQSNPWAVEFLHDYVNTRRKVGV